MPDTPEEARQKIREIAEQEKARIERERPRTYAERLQDMGRLPKPTGGSGGSGTGGGGGADMPPGFMPGKKGGKGPIDYKKGGKVSSASKRGDGCCIKGKTKGRMV